MPQTNGQKLLSLYKDNVCLSSGAKKMKQQRKQREHVEYIANEMDPFAIARRLGYYGTLSSRRCSFVDANMVSE